MALVLLSGRPGAGKTAFAIWLTEHHDFVRVETDSEVKWEQLLRVTSAEEAFARRNEAAALALNVIIEWGFMPALLRCVGLLRAAGFDAWWFDGDEPAARRGYINRRGESPGVMNNYWGQVGNIEAIRPTLEDFYGDHLIRTVTARPTYLTFDEIASAMSLAD